MVWEHMVVTTSVNDNNPIEGVAEWLVKILDFHGKRGWEVVHIQEADRFHEKADDNLLSVGRQFMYIVFKKPKQ